MLKFIQEQDLFNKDMGNKMNCDSNFHQNDSQITFINDAINSHNQYFNESVQSQPF